MARKRLKVVSIFSRYEVGWSRRSRTDVSTRSRGSLEFYSHQHETSCLHCR